MHKRLAAGADPVRGRQVELSIRTFVPKAHGEMFDLPADRAVQSQHTVCRDARSMPVSLLRIFNPSHQAELSC